MLRLRYVEAALVVLGHFALPVKLSLIALFFVSKMIAGKRYHGL